MSNPAWWLWCQHMLFQSGRSFFEKKITPGSLWAARIWSILPSKADPIEVLPPGHVEAYLPAVLLKTIAAGACAGQTYQSIQQHNARWWIFLLERGTEASPAPVSSVIPASSAAWFVEDRQLFACHGHQLGQVLLPSRQQFNHSTSLQ